MVQPQSAPVLASLLASTLLLGSAAGQTLASYDAGTAGSPPTAPDPSAQGWTHVDPSGGVVGFSPVSPDGSTGLNAWQVDDPGTAVNTRGHYQALFTPQQIQSAADLGWLYEVQMRPVTTSGNNLFFEYSSGTSASDDRYLLFFQVSGTDVVAYDFLAGTQFLCPGGADGSYHSWGIQKPAASLDAEILFDGQVVGPLLRAGANSNAAPGGIHWGSGSSGATMTCNFHQVAFRIEGNIGSTYCGPAVPNTTGASGEISAAGSLNAADNNLVLSAESLPLGQFGIFLVAPSQGFFPGTGGSVGNLCLSGAIGRYNGPGQIQTSGTSGSFSLTLDLNDTPTPTGPIAIQAGETWHFQCWYRDWQMGMAISNFTNATTLVFP